MASIYYRGVPRTSDEWAALAKVAGGHTSLSRDELRVLFMLGLVDRQWGRVCLSEHGRTTLGLPHGASAATGLAFLRQDASRAGA